MARECVLKKAMELEVVKRDQDEVSSWTPWTIFDASSVKIPWATATAEGVAVGKVALR